ncbi:MAG: DUF6308 family protein [Motilibacteraceae bacterium]
MSVQVPPEASHALVEGRRGRHPADQLSQIALAVELPDRTAAALLAEGSPAHRAWLALNEIGGIGWVTAG